MLNPNILILEDDLITQYWVKKLVQDRCPEAAVVHVFASVREAVKAMESTQYDIVCTDVMLEDGYSFEVFQKVTNQNPILLFFSSHAEFAIPALRAKAVDYLLKPFKVADFNAALDRCLAQWKQLDTANSVQVDTTVPEQIMLKTQSALYLVKVSDILYCQSEGAYTTFFINDGKKHILSRSLREVEDFLVNQPLFFRIHQSYIINLRYAKAFLRNQRMTAIMIDGVELPVAERRRSDLLAVLEQFPHL
jgi:two-component system LytT family response regulator